MTLTDQCQFADSPSYVRSLHLVNQRSPALILVPPSFLGPTLTSKRKEGFAGDAADERDEGTLLVRSLKAAWKDTPIVPVSRKFWNEHTGKLSRGAGE